MLDADLCVESRVLKKLTQYNIVSEVFLYMNEWYLN